MQRSQCGYLAHSGPVGLTLKASMVSISIIVVEGCIYCMCVHRSILIASKFAQLKMKIKKW